MSQVTQPNHLYNAILHALNVDVVNDECFRVAFDSSGKEPLVSPEGKQWLVPTNTYLANPQWNKYLHFHPLCESSLRGESQCQKMLNRLISARITQVIQHQITALLEIGANNEIHKDLKGKRHEALAHLADVKDSTVKTWESIRKKITVLGDHRLFRLYIKNGGKWNDIQYARVAVVRFPFYEELASDSATVFGVKMNKTDRATFIKVMEYILPGLDDANTYNRGSSGMTAVTFHTSMLAFGNLAVTLNRTSKLFANYFEEGLRMEIDVSWIADLDNISQWRDSYGNFDESVGEAKEGELADTTQSRFNPNHLSVPVSTTPLAPTHVSSNFQQPTTKTVVPEPTTKPGTGLDIATFFGNYKPAGVLINNLEQTQKQGNILINNGMQNGNFLQQAPVVGIGGMPVNPIASNGFSFNTVNTTPSNNFGMMGGMQALSNSRL
jgi:hypothetical protein